MTITPSNIFDHKDRQLQASKGYLTFRLYPDGWLVRFTPYLEGSKPETLNSADVYAACAFANDRLNY